MGFNWAFKGLMIERERERGRDKQQGSIEGRRMCISFLVSSQVSPVRPSGRISMKMKMYEEDDISIGDCWGLK